MGDSIPAQFTLIQEDYSVAQPCDGRHVMAHKEDRASLLCDALHFSQAFLLKRDVSYRQYLINNEDVWFQMSCYRKCQSQIHPAGIMLDWSVDELLHVGKVHDFIKLSGDLGPFHSQNRAIHIYVLSSREFAVKSCSHLE